MRDGDCVAIGWGKLGDLSGLDATRDGRDRLQNLLAERHPANPSVTGRARNQVMNFLTAMAEGDVVLAADGGTVLGIGRVTGEYAFDGSSDFPHRRPVEWLSLDEWKLPQPEGLQTTVHQVKQTPNLLEVERRVQGAAARPGHQPPDIIKRPEGAARPQPPRLAGVPGLIQSVLERKGQCILYGPPGTGKTFWAERAALDLAAHRAFGRAFGDLNAGEKAAAVGDGRGGLVRLCTFHSTRLTGTRTSSRVTARRRPTARSPSGCGTACSSAYAPTPPGTRTGGTTCSSTRSTGGTCRGSSASC
jgi:5-methylcytosine-specific restriction protein B